MMCSSAVRAVSRITEIWFITKSSLILRHNSTPLMPVSITSEITRSGHGFVHDLQSALRVFDGDDPVVFLQFGLEVGAHVFVVFDQQHREFVPG